MRFRSRLRYIRSTTYHMCSHTSAIFLQVMMDKMNKDWWISILVVAWSTCNQTLLQLFNRRQSDHGWHLPALLNRKNLQNDWTKRPWKWIRQCINAKKFVFSSAWMPLSLPATFARDLRNKNYKKNFFIWSMILSKTKHFILIKVLLSLPISQVERWKRNKCDRGEDGFSVRFDFIWQSKNFVDWKNWGRYILHCL